MKFACHCLDLTPQKPCMIEGFSRPGNFERVHDPIVARLFLLETNGVKTIFVGTDLGALADMYDLILKKISLKNIDIKPENLVIGHSSNHSGPKIEGEYLEYCSSIMSDAIVELWKKETEIVQVKYSNVQIDGLFSVADDVNLLCDKGVEILGFFKEEKLQAMFLNFGILCTEIKYANEISSDLFGGVRMKLEEKYGVPVLMAQACCGRVSTRQYRTQKFEKEYDSVEKFSIDFSSQVFAKLSWSNVSVDTFTYNEIKYNDIFYADQSRYQNKIALLKSQLLEIENTEEVDLVWEEIKELHDAAMFNQDKEVSFEIRFYQFGEVLIITIPVKLGPEFGLKIKANFKNKCIIWGSTNRTDEFYMTDKEYMTEESRIEKYYHPKGTARKFSNVIIKQIKQYK